MIYTYNVESLLKRTRTDIKDEEGKTIYWGIYDFSYKYRTRVFDSNDEECAYVEKDISDINEPIICFDSKGNELFRSDKDRLKQIRDEISKGIIDCDRKDLLNNILEIFGAVVLEEK